jgi:hypothetical protein
MMTIESDVNKKKKGRTSKSLSKLDHKGKGHVDFEVEANCLQDETFDG